MKELMAEFGVQAMLRTIDARAAIKSQISGVAHVGVCVEITSGGASENDEYTDKPGFRVHVDVSLQDGDGGLSPSSKHYTANFSFPWESEFESALGIEAALRAKLGKCVEAIRHRIALGSSIDLFERSRPERWDCEVIA